MATPLLARECRIYIHDLALRLGVPVKGSGLAESIEVFPKHDAIGAGEVWQRHSWSARNSPRCQSPILVLWRRHYCPAKISEGHPNPLKISMITHGRSENDFN